MRATRQEIRQQLEGLLTERLREDDFMRWLTAIESGAVEIHPHDAPLVAAVINLFEDASIVPYLRRGLAHDYLRCLESDLRVDEVAGLLRLVFSRHRLCALVEKWRSGVLESTDFRAFIRNSRLLENQKQWLIRASPEAASYLCHLLTSRDYEEVVRLLQGG